MSEAPQIALNDAVSINHNLSYQNRRRQHHQLQPYRNPHKKIKYALARGRISILYNISRHLMDDWWWLDVVAKESISGPGGCRHSI